MSELSPIGSRPCNVPPVVGTAGVLAYQGPVGVRPGEEDELDQFAEDMQKASNYRAVRKTLRRSGIGGLIWGLIALGLGGAMLRQNPINALLLLLGVALLVEGLWLLIRPMPVGMIVDGVLLILFGVWNIFVTVHNAILAGPGGNGGGPWGAVAVVQIAMGVYSFVRYARVKREGMIEPTAEVMGRLDRIAKDLQEAKVGEDPDLVEFTVKGFNGDQAWKCRFVGAYAICLSAKTYEIFFVQPGHFALRSTGKVMLSKRLKFEGRMRARVIKGTMTAEGLGRFETWKRGRISEETGNVVVSQ
jgi:hypothetical protein